MWFVVIVFSVGNTGPRTFQKRVDSGPAADSERRRVTADARSPNVRHCKHGAWPCAKTPTSRDVMPRDVGADHTVYRDTAGEELMDRIAMRDSSIICAAEHRTSRPGPATMLQYPHTH